MSFETWRQDAVQHYAALARIRVPFAAEAARLQAEEAERQAEGLLAGLVDEVRAELAKPKGIVA